MSDTGPQGQPDDALVDLAIKQVTEGLSPAEQRALDAMDSAAATGYLRDFERAAAAVTLAATPSTEPLPAHLRARIEQEAQSHFAAGPVATQPTANVVDFASRGVAAAPSPPNRSRSAALAWFAAAACLVLALFAWFRQPPPATQIAAVPVPVPVEAPPPPTPAEERVAMLAKPDVVKVVLTATKDPAAAGVTGDVVWDPNAQKGYLHFVGLAANDPQVRQYQIWIFDGERDQRYPVDGGVFDVPANSTEVVIPIHAELRVKSAKAFAVSAEKPGGAVVSARDHILVLGAAG
jgi:Anti-sigma-K factor rskA